MPQLIIKIGDISLVDKNLNVSEENIANIAAANVSADQATKALIEALVKFRGIRFLKDISEEEVVFIANRLEIEAKKEDLRKDTVAAVSKALNL